MLFFFIGHTTPVTLICLKTRTELLEEQVCPISNYFHSAKVSGMCLEANFFKTFFTFSLGKDIFYMQV